MGSTGAGLRNSTKLGYRPQLDALRAFAVFAVFVVHFVREEGAVRSMLPWGALGVQLFFVLSGFLITRILLGARSEKEGNRGGILRRFYCRRFLRLFPPYYLYLAFAAIALPYSRQYLVIFMVYGQNFLFALRPEVFSHVMAHFWTLAVEEQFYLIWPWLVLFLPRKWLVGAISVCVTAAPIGRGIALACHATSHQVNMMMPFHFDTLGMGALLAVLSAYGSGEGRSAGRLMNCGLWIGLPLLCASVVAERFDIARGIQLVVGEGAAGLAFVWLVGRASEGFGGIAGKVLAWTPLLYLGRISYGLYVYHFNVPGMMRDVVMPRLHLSLPSSDWVRYVIFSAVTVGVASASWYAIERPVNRLKRFFPYQRRRKVMIGVNETAGEGERVEMVVH
jgi:peptidoglycan/LPS O-acetylase OafA/YrhL